MRILLTGTAGLVGSYTLRYLLQRGHTILALDRIPLPQLVLDSLSDLTEEQLKAYEAKICELTDYEAFETLLTEFKPEGVIHLGSIPSPRPGVDHRIIHNNNVTGSYNVLHTCAVHGIKRIVQASSVNATGLSYSPEGHNRFYEMPVKETHPLLPEDPYALSKAICEIQAGAITRYYPGVRVASLRFHMVKSTYEDAIPHSRPIDGFAWTSYDAAASSCLRGLISEGWEGHEVFMIAAPEICWEAGTSGSSEDVPDLQGKVPTLELLDRFWKGKVTGLKEDFWANDPRRTTFDSRKAEKLLGWDHDRAAEMDI